MVSTASLILGLALAMDAGVATFALGLLSLEISHQQRWTRGVAVALVFGAFQFAMLWLGSYGGYLFSFSGMGHLFQFVVAGIFILIGVRFLQEAFGGAPRQHQWGLVPVLLLALATSIDALAAGVSLGTLPLAYHVAFEIGAITFCVCMGFYVLSQFFNKLPDKWLLAFASAVFFLLGGRVIAEQFL